MLSQAVPGQSLAAAKFPKPRLPPKLQSCCCQNHVPRLRVAVATALFLNSVRGLINLTEEFDGQRKLRRDVDTTVPTS